MTTTQIRKSAAELAREIRAMRPTLKGEWTTRGWNEQVRGTVRRYIANMHRFFKVNT